MSVRLPGKTLQRYMLPAGALKFAKLLHLIYVLGSEELTQCNVKTTSTLEINLYGQFGHHERESLKSHLRYSTILTVFSFRKGATDEMLQVLGTNCKMLQV